MIQRHCIDCAWIQKHAAAWVCAAPNLLRLKPARLFVPLREDPLGRHCQAQWFRPR